MMKNSTAQAYVVMTPSGETYAVEYNSDGTIRGCTGPLHHSEIKPENLGNYDCADEFSYLGEDGETVLYEEGTHFRAL